MVVESPFLEVVKDRLNRGWATFLLIGGYSLQLICLCRLLMSCCHLCYSCPMRKAALTSSHCMLHQKTCHQKALQMTLGGANSALIVKKRLQHGGKRAVPCTHRAGVAVTTAGNLGTVQIGQL